MRSRTVQALTVTGVAGILAGAALVSTSSGPASEGDPAPARDRSSPEPDAVPAKDGTKAEGVYKAVIELPDGRKVEIRHVKGKGLGERHYDPGTGKWSRTNLIYETQSDPCQGVRLAATGGTVAVTADFGLFCYDGEPPEKSVAAVATGEFTEWQTNRHDRSDGWEKTRVTEKGERVSFVRWTEDLIVTLRWSKANGFARPEEKPRPPTKLVEEFFGGWKSGDAIQRVAVQKQGNGAVATFFSQNRDCVTRVGLIPMSENEGQFIEVFREKGDRSKGCPAYSDSDFMKLNKAGTQLLSLQEFHAHLHKDRAQRGGAEAAASPRTCALDRVGWASGNSRTAAGASPSRSRSRAVDRDLHRPGGLVAAARSPAASTAEFSMWPPGGPSASRVRRGRLPPKLGEFILPRDGRTFTQKVGGEALTHVGRPRGRLTRAVCGAGAAPPPLTGRR